jgi:hypothetical protein
MKDMNARDFGFKFNNKMSVRVFHGLVMRPLSELTLKEIQEKDFLRIRNLGTKSWNEFVEIRNSYFIHGEIVEKPKNKDLISKCYLVVGCTMFEGYYFSCSKVFINRNEAEKYIETLDENMVFDIKELDLIG